VVRTEVPDPELAAQLYRNPYRAAAPRLPAFTPATAERVRAFHRTLPEYDATPLHELGGLARELGMATVWLKDESARFGLKAFKGLGASYALARAATAAGEIPLIVATATDGNHGRAVAWAAREQGHAAVIYVPAAASRQRVEAIAALGAEVRRCRGTYDDACALAAAAAEQHDWLLLQDTARPGYEQIPQWIMQGYMTLMDETLEQLAGAMPTHVFLQCGVGSFAASVVAYLAARLDPMPTIVLVEPQRAPCALAAFEADVATPPLLDGDTHTFMACLACGQLSSLAWDILRTRTDFVMTVADDIAREGMRMLARPQAADPAVVSGESGAATTGALLHLCAPGARRTDREMIGLDADARVLLISTEGDTDPAVYRNTVGGA